MTSSRRDFLRNLGISGFAAASPSAAGILHADRAVDRTEPIYLDRNENPYGPSAKVREAIREASLNASEYPRRQAKQLIERIAQLHKIHPSQVILAAGSTEILRAACNAFLGKGKRLIQPAPTFPDAESYARMTGAEIASEPPARNFEFNFDAMLPRSGAGLVYLCNPNNPTGTVSSHQHFEAFLSELPSNYKVLVDEAYYEFCVRTNSNPSFLERPLDDRTIVTRTFSLVHGLAGLRIGYGVASPALVAQMRPFVSQNSVNSVAFSAAIAALDDVDGLAESIRLNANTRQEFNNACTARSIKPLDSHANFVAFNIYNPANLVIRYFRENNIHIAPVSLSWDSYLRVSLGKPEDMQTFWRVWDQSPIDKSSIRH